VNTLNGNEHVTQNENVNPSNKENSDGQENPSAGRAKAVGQNGRNDAVDKKTFQIRQNMN